MPCHHLHPPPDVPIQPCDCGSKKIHSNKGFVQDMHPPNSNQCLVEACHPHGRLPYDNCNSWNKASPKKKPGKPSKKSGENETSKTNTTPTKRSKTKPKTYWNKSKKKKNENFEMHFSDCELRKTCRNDERRTTRHLSVTSAWGRV